MTEEANSLRATDLEVFRRLGIPTELVEQAGVERVSDAEARGKYGIVGPGDMSGIAFPYFPPASGPRHRWTARVRRDYPDVEDGKPRRKYMAPFGDKKHLYFPPGAADSIADVTVPVVFVEAEKSSLALTAWSGRTGRRLLAVALGGCYGWKGRIGRTENASGTRVDEYGPLADLDCADGREVIIMLDANASSNPAVRKARFELARELARRASAVRIADVPEVAGCNGPDDIIGACGDWTISSLLETARSFAEVAVSEAEGMILELEQNPQVKTAELSKYFELLAAVDNPEQRALLIGRTTKALGRQLSKGHISAAVERLRAEHNKTRSELVEKARQAALKKQQIWPATLIADLETFFAERAYLPEGAALTLALWTLNTWTFRCFDTVPYLNLESAVPGCGKTTVAGLLQRVCATPIVAAALTEATMFRIVAESIPTLLIDEGEMIEGKSDRAQAMRAIAQLGYKRGGRVPRCDGDDHQIKYFDVYCPKLFALIGGLSGPLLERCIVIHMERKPRGDRRKSCRERVLNRAVQPLIARLEAYALQAPEELTKLYDAEPEEGYWPHIVDREAEIWGPLLIHARLAGPEIEARLLNAVSLLSRQKVGIQEQDWNVALTIELREAVAKQSEERFTPADLLPSLSEGDSWATKLNRYREDDSKSRSAAVGRFLAKFRLKSRQRERTGISYLKLEALDILCSHTPRETFTAFTDTCTKSATGEAVENEEFTSSGESAKDVKDCVAYRTTVNNTSMNCRSDKVATDAPKQGDNSGDPQDWIEEEL